MKLSGKFEKPNIKELFFHIYFLYFISGSGLEKTALMGKKLIMLREKKCKNKKYKKIHPMNIQSFVKTTLKIKVKICN